MTTTDKREAYREIVHSPADLAAEKVRWAEHILTSPGVPFGIADVDREMNPAHPGDVVVLCARPGHGKTSLLATIARSEARRIQERGTEKTEAVFYITWEQVAEEIDLILDANDDYTVADIMRGKADMDAIRCRAVKRVQTPIWVIGDSIGRTSTKSLRLFTDVVCEAIEIAVEDYGVTPTLLCFDYIQIIPVREASEQTMQVLYAAQRVKELAKRIGAPAFVGAQARREVDDREFKIPTMRDAQWASAIEQVTDKFFGMWRPWLTDKDKEPIQVGGLPIPITEELMIVQMSKQRFGPAGFTWAKHFSPAHLKLCDLELQRHELDF